MANKTISTMTSAQAFTKLLDDKKNGLDDNLRGVWKHRHSKGGISPEKIDYQLRKYGYKEVAAGAWV